MKKILLALAAMVAVSGASVAVAQPHNDRVYDRGYGRHVVIPDRVETKYIVRENRRVKVTTTYHCEEQRRATCLRWSKHVERDITSRRFDR